MTDRNPAHRRVATWFVSTIIAALLLIVVAAVANRTSRGDLEGGVPATFVVRRGPLTISVTESGTIKPLNQRIIKSEVEGQTTIIQLVDEGTVVREGELLVQLDASKLEDQKVDQKIKVQNAEAAFIRSREELEVVKSQNTSDIARAELDDRFAGEDLTRYTEGEYPKLLKEADAKVTLAEEELNRAADKYEWSKVLLKEKYLSETECGADRLAHKRADLEKDLAEESLKLLREYTHKRTLTELEAEIVQKKMSLDRVRRTAVADRVQTEADLKAKEAEFEQQKGKLAKIEDQISKTKIHAPVGGMVVYASSAKGSWRGNAAPLDEGQSVRERQELIYLPTADSMMSEIKVHESSLDKIRPGLSVTVRVDALPDRTYRGKVARIAPLPDAQSLWLNPDLKVFSTHIHLDGRDPKLRTGMSSESTIIVERYDDVLHVPVQAVVRRDGRPTVFVMDGTHPAPRTVEIGLDNNSMVHIVRGLEVGERVLLTPPLSAANPGASRPRSKASDEGRGPSRPGVTRADPGPRPDGEAERRMRSRRKASGPGDGSERPSDNPRPKRRERTGERQRPQDE